MVDRELKIAVLVYSASKPFCTAFFCHTSIATICVVSPSESEPLKRVAASISFSSATRLGECHTALVIKLLSEAGEFVSISKGSTTVVKVPMVTLFFLTGSVALPLAPWGPEGPTWDARCGGGGGGGVLESSLQSFPFICMLRGMVLTCVSTNTGEEFSLNQKE